MSLPPTWIVWLLIPLVGLPAMAQPRATAVTPAVRQLEVPSPQGELEIPVGPEHPTTVLFDARLAQEAVERASHELGFQRVAVSQNTLMLLPGRGLKTGARLRLPVLFADGQTPASVTLVLVVQPTDADAYVEVHRRPRAGAACQEALAAERTRSMAKDAELVALRVGLAALRPEEASLTVLVAKGILGAGGVRSSALKAERWRRTDTLQYGPARLYVAEGRMAVEVELTLLTIPAWAPGPATLTRNAVPVPARSVLLVEGPTLQPNGKARLMVEWEAPEAHPDKPPPTYRLDVIEQGGNRALEKLCLGNEKC